MLINLLRTAEGHSVLDQAISLPDDEEPESPKFSGSVQCHAEIDRLHSQIHLQVSYACTVLMVCSRCMARYEMPVKGMCRIVLSDRSKEHSGEAWEEIADFTYEPSQDVVDVGSAIYDDILTGMPMKPLCSEECKGITEALPGKVTVEYGQSSPTIDPRWAKLGDLKAKYGKNSEAK